MTSRIPHRRFLPSSMTPFLVLLTLLVNLTGFATAVNGDPCGPAVQDNPNYPNTCSLVPSLVQSPQAYGINCTRTEPANSKAPNEAPEWGNCTVSINDTCTRLVDYRTTPGIWIWTALADSCTLGFFLPPYRGSAPVPQFDRCVEIFTAMNDTCSTTTSPTQWASVNLATLPGFDPGYFVGPNAGKGSGPTSDYGFNGNAVNVGYPSYAIKIGG